MKDNELITRKNIELALLDKGQHNRRYRIGDFWELNYDEIREVLDDVDSDAQPVMHWIPCSERMPEDEYVLISKKPTKISGDKWSVAIAIRTADPRSRKIQWRDSGFGVIQDDKVLAWMPLPKPYKEGDTE